ncbi:hypothetical protein LSH36_469g02041 [Paralvinella palmiformis]|uniref:Cytochrome P450 n=1 Tax=Paralvinella palmiformis TaxID=53620 RepID=A0AAD9MYP1_9ANNE|nr:hypothetical protein LSH36_469g02041 [Paralvinella palmiformis]
MQSIKSRVKEVFKICKRCQLTTRSNHSRCPFSEGDTPEMSTSELDYPERLSRTEHGSCNEEHHLDIPGPKSFPLIGTLYKYLPFVGSYDIRDQMGTDRKRFKEFGPLVRERMFPGFTVYHVYDLDLIRHVYHQERNFPNRFPLPGLKAYRELRKTGKGIALSSGEEWWQQRRSASDLMRSNYIANFYDEQVRIADDFNRLFSASVDERGEVADTLPLCYRFALESIGNVLFGKRLGTLNPGLDRSSDAMLLIDAVLGAMEALCHTTYFWPLHKNQRTKMWKKLCRSIDFIMEVGMKHAEQLKGELEDGGPNTRVSYMKTILSKPGLTTEDALILMTDVIFAGIESTGLVILYNLYNLARNPDKQELFYQEIVRHAPAGEPLTQESVKKMAYVRAAMKESFRFTPIGVGNARILTKDLHYKGYKIPKESLCLLNTTMACESPQYVSQHDQYIPERWLGSLDDKLHPYLILPFGLGGRSCLGRRLSMMEMQVALIKLVRKYKFEYHHEDIGFVTKFGNTPDRPVKLAIKRRLP